MPMTADRKYQYLTDKQADFIASLVEARFVKEDPRREELREMFSAIRANSDVDRMIKYVLAFPTLASQLADEVAQAKLRQPFVVRPSEDGFYRNPETGELWRLSHGKRHDLIVAKYTKTGGPRRLVSDTNEVVKGKWAQLGKFDSRKALSVQRADWLISGKELARDYAYAFCPFHNGPLTDAISVVLGYGKDCAEKEGLPWGEETMRQVLAARQSAQAS